LSQKFMKIICKMSSECFLNLPESIACVFGTFTNGICIVVFLHPKMKDESFRYMLAQSISDFIYSSVLSFQPLLYCPASEIRKKYILQLYFIVLVHIFTSILGIFYIFVETWISLQRYLMLKKKKFLEKVSYKTKILLFGLASFIFYFIKFFSYKITSKTIFNNYTHCLWSIENKLSI